MNDREMRELLQEIIDGVDQGRVEVERPRTLQRAGTALAAAAALGLGLGLASCSGPANKNVSDPGNGRPRASQMDAGPIAEYAAPAMPPPMHAMRPDAPVPAYAVPAPPPMRTKPRPKPMKDPGSVAAYVAPEVSR